MGSQTLNSWIRGCTRQMLIILGIGGVVLLVFGGLVGLALSVPGATPDTRSLIIAIGLMALTIAALVGVILWGILQISRRAAWLDAVFSPCGLAGKPYLMNGRRYQGEVYGRNIDVYFSRGPLLELYVTAALHTRMAVGTEDALGAGVAQALKQSRMETGDPAYRNLVASATDESWGRSLLTDPRARPIILGLTRTEGPYELRHVAVQPDAMVLRFVRLPQPALTAERVQGWLRDLADLAQIAEDLPAPRESLAPTRLEHNSHNR